MPRSEQSLRTSSLDGVIQMQDGMWPHQVQARRRSVWQTNEPYSGTSSDSGGFDPVDELHVALYAISDVGRCIQSADTKSGMLGAVLGLTIAGATSQMTLVRTTVTSAGGLHSAAVVLLFAFAATLLAAGAFLGLSQMPRLGVSHDVRRLAFPALARSAELAQRAVSGARAEATGDRWHRPGAAELRDEAWRQAETLARIAVHKFRYLRASLVCSGLCVVSFLLWLGLSSVIAT
jgi:hypothetical protein